MSGRNCHADRCSWKCALPTALHDTGLPVCPERAPPHQGGCTFLQMVYQRMEQQAAAEAEDDDSGERAALEAEEMTLLKVPYQALRVPQAWQGCRQAHDYPMIFPAGRRSPVLRGAHRQCGQPPCCQHHLSLLLAWDTPVLHRLWYCKYSCVCDAPDATSLDYQGRGSVSLSCNRIWHSQVMARSR